jgi:thioredoxin-like negative regulator of GroEL
MWLETGQLRKAESIMGGLNEVAPDFAPAWMGTALLKALSSDFEGALVAAQQAQRLEPHNVDALLLVASMSLSLGDVSTAGTFLGEVAERIEQGEVHNPNAVRLFKMQLARFQSRA